MAKCLHHIKSSDLFRKMKMMLNGSSNTEEPDLDSMIAHIFDCLGAITHFLSPEKKLNFGETKTKAFLVGVRSIADLSLSILKSGSSCINSNPILLDLLNK